MSTLSTDAHSETDVGPSGSRSSTATAVGLLFIVQMITAMFGTSMVEKR